MDGASGLADCAFTSHGHEGRNPTPSATDDGPVAESSTPERRPTVAFSGILGESRIDPVGLAVAPGDTVVFRNDVGLELGAPHSTRAYHPANDAELRIPRDADPWHGPLMGPGETFAVALDVEGTYDYYCATHRVHGAVGRIDVGRPGGPAHGSDPPHGTLPSGRRIVERGTVGFEGREG